MGPGGGVPAAPLRLLVPLLLLLPPLLLLLAPCVSLIRADDSSTSPNSLPLSSSPATNASATTADVLGTVPSGSPLARGDPVTDLSWAVNRSPSPSVEVRVGSTEGDVAVKASSDTAHQPVQAAPSNPVTPAAAAGTATPTTTTPVAERKQLLVAYLSNVAGTDNLRRQGLVVSGAMKYAVELVNRNRSIPGYRMEMMYRDTRGEMLHGTRAVLDCWKGGAIAFFGPEDSCYVEAAVAASLNLPMISYPPRSITVRSIARSPQGCSPREASLVRCLCVSVFGNKPGAKGPGSERCAGNPHEGKGTGDPAREDQRTTWIQRHVPNRSLWVLGEERGVGERGLSHDASSAGSCLSNTRGQLKRVQPFVTPATRTTPSCHRCRGFR
ncbi:hypothetical protein HPB49_022721 [Dermacentor silvarum]|uniref:Uncharacterized protein n=1 Tax=Dermacentor silvarum TaxID=543639 RepID=A0ACB8CTL8_DERSI|nr:hypothetical protein HPB49_022721 [Dermacentor silvarum]